MDEQTQQTQSQPMEGTSNPPNGGQVTDIANPEANDTTNPLSAASDTPPPAGATQATPTPGANSAPVQGNTTNGPTQGQPKQPDLSKAPTGQGPQGTVPQGPPPAVQKASMFHEVAQALAGGPRFSYSVDEYGNMQKKQIPISNGHLALAIAMEALTGAAAGFGVQNGPGAKGRAAAAGFAASQKQQQQITQQAKDQATQDFARKAQTTEMNMRLALNARQIGRMDEEDTDKYIAQYKDVADDLEKNHQGYLLATGVSYKDLSKYNVTSDTAIPYKKVPRLDSTGHQVYINGMPKYDINYMILKPNFRGTGMLTKEGQDTLNKWGVSGMDNPNLKDTAMNARLGLNLMSRATHLSTAESAYDNIFSKVDEANDVGKSSSSADVTQPGTLHAPDLKGNTAVQSMVDSAASKFAPAVKSVIAPDNFQAILRGLVNQESGGNPDAKSPTGAKGIGQFTTATAKQYGLIDAQGNDYRNDPQKNANATAHYFSDLLNQYKGDPKKALAAYYSGPGAINANGQIQNTTAHTAADTQKYVDSISGKIGLSTTGGADVATQTKHPSPTDWAKEHPTFAKDTEAFMGAYDAAGNSVDAALKHLQSTGQGDVASNISAYLKQYGDDTITTHDNYLQTQAEDRKLAEQTKFAEQKSADKQAQQQSVQKEKEAAIGTLLTAKMPDHVLQMSDTDAVKSLADQGVSLPADALIEAKAVASYAAPMSTASNKRWFADKKVDQGELLSIVRQFNPTYKTENFDAIRATQMPNSPVRKTVDSAAQLANHLNTLSDLIDSQAADKSPLPMLNKMAQHLGYQAGGTDLTNVQAMANIVTSELGKTLSGGFAPDKEQIQNIIKTMTPENTTQQMKQIVGLYVKAMHGKVAPLDDDFNQMSGAADQHLVIPKSLTNILQKYGEETPWQKNNQTTQQQPQVPQGYKAMTRDGKMVQTMTGDWIQNPAQQQQVQQQSNMANQFVQSQR